MPDYATTPDAIESEIRNIDVTFEPITDSMLDGMDIHDRDLMEECYYYAGTGSKEVIRNLRKLAGKYPKVPGIKNNLMIAFSNAGKESEANRISREISKLHPDYLFGRIMEAQNALEKSDTIQRVPELLGNTLRLTDFEPERTLYHMSEVRGYYAIVLLFHLRAGRSQTAHRIHEVLVDLFGEDDPTLQHLKGELMRDNLGKIQERIKEDEDRRISVRVEPPANKRQPELFTPGMLRPEIQALYEYGTDFPADERDLVLKEPREILIPELEAVLHDCINRSEDYIEESFDFYEVETWFPVHALVFLGEFKAENSLPVVLELLSQSDEMLEWWFGDTLETLLWQPFYHLMQGQLAPTKAWLLSPGIASRSRSTVGKAIAHIALDQPGRRDEILTWFREVLEFLRDSPPGDNILDTEVVTSLVSALCDIRAVELRDLIFQLEEKGYISEFMIGGREEIGAALTKPLNFDRESRLFSLPEFYRELNRRFGDHDEEFRSSPVSLPDGPGLENLMGAQAPHSSFSSYSPQESYKAPPKVGRNDSCPCGSGRKFKKCCG